MSAVVLPLRFQLGARTLASIPRRLVRVPLSLDGALAGRVPALPPLDPRAHGYAVTSLPADRHHGMTPPVGMIGFVRQRYTRYHADLSGGAEGYAGRLSANTRQGMRRKAKKLAQVSGGALDVRRYRTPDELAAFHAVARGISVRTYQERLLGGGLPDDDAFLRRMVALAAADQVRAWLLFVAGQPAAYLYCAAEGESLRYDHVGHDPAFGDLSPGGVLQAEALRDLAEEGRFRRFDFTEGEGQHKRQFATGGVACLDLLLLRATLGNRLATLAVGGFDRGAAAAKRVVERWELQELAKRVRR